MWDCTNLCLTSYVMYSNKAKEPMSLDYKPVVNNGLEIFTTDVSH